MKVDEFPYAVVAEWMCFIASILLLKEVYPSYWKLFTLYMGITATLESYCLLIRKITSMYNIPLPNNGILYNFHLIICILFHLLIFFKIIDLRNIWKTILLVFIIILVAYVTNLIQGNFLDFLSTANTIFGGCIIFLSTLYYFSLFKQDEYKDILKEPAFWFVTGCLIFYTTKSGVNAFHEQLVQFSSKNKFSISYLISNILSVIMYSCWVKAFLCLKKNQAYSQ